MLPAVAASSCPARPHLSSPRNRPRQRDRVLALQLLTLRPDDNAMLNPSSRSERRLRPQLRNHTTSCTTSPEISIRHPPGIRSLPSITKPPKITVAGVPARAPANAKVSTGRSQVTSGPRPPTAPAPPSGRPSLPSSPCCRLDSPGSASLRLQDPGSSLPTPSDLQPA